MHESGTSSDTGIYTDRPVRIGTENLRDCLVPVIIGGDVLAYSFVREFNRAYGINRCIAIMTDDIKMMTSSRFTDCRIIPDSNTPENLPHILADIAQEERRRNAECILLALGTDDSVAGILASNREMLSACGYVIPYEDAEKIEHLSKKHIFYSLCDELDVPYPKTWYMDCSSEGPDELPIDELPMPLVMKPSDSSEFKHAHIPGKRKAYELFSRKEALEVWRSIKDSDYNGELIIQDFIPGDDTNLRIINMFTDADGNIRVLSSGQLVLQDHCPTALGNPITILGERDQKLVDYVTAFQKRIKFHGWSTFDIKYDIRTDDYVFFEINIRPGRSSYYISLGGVNFITPIVEDFVLGQEVPHQEAYRPFVYNLVPKYVLRRSIEDKSLLEKVLETLKVTKPDPDPLHYSKDSFAHNFWAWLMKVNQIRKFKRYLWDS